MTLQMPALEPEALVDAFHRLGARLRGTSPAAVVGWLRSLGDTAHPRSLMAELALGHGALAGPGGACPATIPSALEQVGH